MRAGFASQCGINQAIDIAPFTQRGAQVDMVVLTEAHIDATLDRQADAVATGAEIIAERGDQAERDRAVLDPEIARRAAGVAIDRKDGAIGAQRRDEMVERNIMIAALIGDLAQRHGLDEGQIAALVGAPVEHRQKLVFVEPCQRDHVDLHRQPGGPGCGDAAQRRSEFADARNVAKGVGVERVETDVDAANPRFDKHRSMVGQPHAVGGQRQFVEPAADERAQLRREQIDPAPYERFAAGEADTADAARNKAFGKYAHFFYIEDCGSRQKLHLLGHTIPTSEVAAIGNGQAQIGDAPTVTVGEWSDRRGGICGHRLNDGAKGKRLASKAC